MTRYQREKGYHEEYRTKNKERRNAAARERARRCKEAGICIVCQKSPSRPGRVQCEKCAEQHTHISRLHNTGCTKAQFTTLFLSQAGKCAICLKTFSSTPHADHDHKTRIVRGLLCSNCNRGIGHLQDDPTVVERAAAYLRLHKKAGEGHTD